MSDEEDNDEICGAETLSGGTCKKPAGWGTDKDTGYCKNHIEPKNEDKKAEFLKYLKKNITSMKEASNHINRHESTVWNWRQEDEEFDEKVRRAKKEQKSMRVDRVKDSMFQRIVKGGAAASETIFWLKNNAGWQTNPDTVVNVAQKNESDGLSSDDFHEVFDDYVDGEDEEEESSGESSEGERCKNSD